MRRKHVCDGDAGGVDGLSGRLRISLTLLTGSVLKAVAAACKPLAMRPVDRIAVGSAGRLANHLDLHADNCGNCPSGDDTEKVPEK
jgi:hypothetical protein